MDGKVAWRDNAFVKQLGRYLNFYNGRRPHWGRRTICPKQHAKGSFEIRLPLGNILKKGFERKNA
ncbi:MAG: hypothetical protein B7Z77_10850 [Acidocella sp. 20-58-15]|nr:MAG: hypothetical protein B7Z77_10850 [Acidocella sp. 20-58-15]